MQTNTGDHSVPTRVNLLPFRNMNFCFYHFKFGFFLVFTYKNTFKTLRERHGFSYTAIEVVSTQYFAAKRKFDFVIVVSQLSRLF